MDVKYPAFRLKKNTIDISSEESTPFFFVLDKSMKIKMLYVVSKDYPVLTSKYLDIVFDRFLR